MTEPKNLNQRPVDTIATPEGDAEFGPTQPLTPGAVEASIEGLETPPGSAPDAGPVSPLEEIGDEIGTAALPQPRAGLDGF